LGAYSSDFNGDLASTVFFGSLPLVAFAGPFSIDSQVAESGWRMALARLALLAEAG
jgi:hypothetical protein